MCQGTAVPIFFWFTYTNLYKAPRALLLVVIYATKPLIQENDGNWSCARVLIIHQQKLLRTLL